MSINSNGLTASDYGGLLEEMATSLAAAPLWDALGYTTELHIDQRSVRIFLSCSSSGSYGAELDAHATLVRLVALVFAFQTLRPTVRVESLLHFCNYLLISWLMNMEHHMPFVFSIYGRSVLRLNYAYSKHVIKAIFPTDNGSDILARTLVKLLTTWVQPEFNLFNILKEVDLSRYRYKRMRALFAEAKAGGKNEMGSGQNVKMNGQNVKMNGHNEKGNNQSEKGNNRNKMRDHTNSKPTPDHRLVGKNIVYQITPIDVEHIIDALQPR